MNNKQKGFIVLPILLICAIIGLAGFTIYKNIDKQPQTAQPLSKTEASESKGNTPLPTKELVEDNKVGAKWITHTNNERGISFDHPEGWDIVYALSGDSTEIDIKSPEKDSLVLIGILSGKSIINKSAIEEAISEKEKEFKISERYISSDFSSSIQDGSGSYAAKGSEYYLSLSSDKSLYEIPVISYKFQEIGNYKVGGKTVILHGMTITSDPDEETIKRIINSFKLK